MSCIRCDASRIVFAAALCCWLLTAAAVFGATKEVRVELSPLSGSQTSAVVLVDLGKPAKLTGPVRAHADVVVERGIYHCNACNDRSPIYLPPPCEFDLPLYMVIGVYLQSGGAEVYGDWWQGAPREFTMDMELWGGANRDLLFSDGTGTFTISYFSLDIDARFACADRYGSGWVVSPGLIEFPTGMTLTIDYEEAVAVEGATWGHVKGRYR
jgi:hypothetical protein